MLVVFASEFSVSLKIFFDVSPLNQMFCIVGRVCYANDDHRENLPYTSKLLHLIILSFIVRCSWLATYCSSLTPVNESLQLEWGCGQYWQLARYQLVNKVAKAVDGWTRPPRLLLASTSQAPAHSRYNLSSVWALCL